MIDDKLFERFPKPDVILGQHVMPPAAGQISYRPGSRSPRRTTSRCG
jgi:metal-dependent amidase/aminoacylase/carboxypeptidase family protein